MKWLDSHDRIPEIDAADLIRLAQDHFSLRCNRVDDRPYLLRFESDKQSIDLPTHGRGKSFSPLAVHRLIRKFKITHEQFCAAYNQHFKLDSQLTKQAKDQTE